MFINNSLGCQTLQDATLYAFAAKKAIFPQDEHEEREGFISILSERPFVVFVPFVVKK